MPTRPRAAHSRPRKRTARRDLSAHVPPRGTRSPEARPRLRSGARASGCCADAAGRAVLFVAISRRQAVPVWHRRWSGPTRVRTRVRTPHFSSKTAIDNICTNGFLSNGFFSQRNLQNSARAPRPALCRVWLTGARLSTRRPRSGTVVAPRLAARRGLRQIRGIPREGRRNAKQDRNGSGARSAGAGTRTLTPPYARASNPSRVIQREARAFSKTRRRGW